MSRLDIPLTLPGANGSRWRIRLDLVIDKGWTLAGVYWRATPDLIKIWVSGLPPIWLVVTETKLPQAGP